MSPAYCKMYGRLYADRHVRAIFEKEKLDPTDINTLSFFSESNNFRVFPEACDRFFKEFPRNEEKFREYLDAEIDSDVDSCASFQTYYLFKDHQLKALSRYGIFDSTYHRRSDIENLIENLSGYELAFLDKFVRDYGRVRGLFYRGNFGDVRTDQPYHAWVQQIKLRDEFSCRKCGSEDNLVAHHITPVNLAPELASDINNGIVLCNKCHRRYHKLVKSTSCNVENLQAFLTGKMRGSDL